MRAVLALAAALALATPVLALAPAPAPEVVRVVAPLSPGLEAAAAATGSTVVLRDEVLGFAAVVTRDPAGLARELGAPVREDGRSGIAVDGVVADAPADALYPAQWGPVELNMQQAWAIEDGSTTVRVAVVDSGMNFAHLDFGGVPVVKGPDYVDGDANPMDLNGHGTHVAGTIAAARDNGLGVAGMARVTLLVTRVLDQNGAGWCSAFASGVRWAADAGAHVINLSLYCSVDDPAVRQAIQYAVGKGALVAVAAGNFQQSNPGMCVTFPARYPEAFAVAAIDVGQTTASFSCRGPEVDVAGPGVNVLSTVLGQSYALYSGTSMATPHVAGAAALLKAENPSWGEAQIRARLTATAKDLGAPGHDVNTGWGLVDPVKALSGQSPVYVPPL